MESNAVDLKNNVKDGIYWTEDSNNLVHHSQKLSVSSEGKLDDNNLEYSFVCVNESEDVPDRDIRCSEDVDPLSIGLVKNEFKNCIPTVSVAPSNNEVSLDEGLLKEENKYSPGSALISEQEFHPDVFTNRNTDRCIADSSVDPVFYQGNSLECQRPVNEICNTVPPEWNFTRAELSFGTQPTSEAVSDNASSAAVQDTPTTSNGKELKGCPIQINNNSQKIAFTTNKTVSPLQRCKSLNRDLVTLHPEKIERDKSNLIPQHRGKSSAKNSRLKNSPLVCTTQRAHSCDYSDRQIGWGSSLLRDLKPHSHRKEYFCDQCGKLFRRRRYVERHLKTHSGIKAYFCNQCGKSFQEKDNFERHLKIHSGIKEYKCDQCAKSFAQKNTLERHLKFHSGIKEYKCKHCGKSFSRKCHLERHLKVHSNKKEYLCEQCGKSFSLKYYLEGHVEVHSIKKEYRCDQCSKSFGRKSDLQRHLKIHLSIKEFMCDQCGWMFVQKTDLGRHLKTHSNILQRV